MPATRLFIVDEHASVRSALAERLERADDCTVVGHTGEANQVINEVRTSQPDVVLLEVKRRDGLGLELLRQLAAMVPAPRLIVLTSYPSAWEEQAACRAGASQYLLKDIEPEELICTISDLVSES